MDVVKANPIATERQQSIENYVAKPLQEKVMDGEKVQAELPDVFTIQKRSKQMLKEIPSATQRLVNPDEYPVYMTPKLAQLQENLVAEEKK
jgi:nicotinate phosphoribosyltransferase